ncbi:MAG: cache domain-containing protein [Geothrix sp.]|jgi:cytochrome c|nr:cache domain-containing protein [Geothrix sp.]
MRPFLATPVLALVLAVSAAAQPAERAKAEAMVKEGIAFLKAKGKDAFIAEVQQASGRFHVKPGSTLYLFVYDPKGLTLAFGMNPAAAGTNRWNLKDPDGKFIIQDIIRTGQKKGGGWTEYKWPNPTTGKVEEKTSFCMAEGDVIMGCGIYK